MNTPSARCECGCDFVRGVDEDEETHRRIHDEYLNGPSIPVVETLKSSGSVAGLRLLAVDSTIPYETRVQLAKAAYVAHRTTPRFPAGYDGSITAADERLFMLTKNDRVISMVLTSLDEPYWQLKWDVDGGIELAAENRVLGLRRKVARVWVAKAYQRRRIALHLLQHIAESFDTSLCSLGWELPLSREGRSLLRRILFGLWLGKGDGYALQKTLGFGADRLSELYCRPLGLGTRDSGMELM